MILHKFWFTAVVVFLEFWEQEKSLLGETRAVGWLRNHWSSLFARTFWSERALFAGALSWRRNQLCSHYGVDISCTVLVDAVKSYFL